MEQHDLTFRVFISSTFSDLVAERNALQEKVFPRLREFCQNHGARFQAIDLRWGVSEEAALDQQTMNICLEELRRCQRTTPRPNFIVLLGQRYGWIPIPLQIDAAEFESLLAVLSDKENKRLRKWYWRDDNAVPAEYCLQPREDQFKDNAVWINEERELRVLLRDAIARVGWPANDPRRLKYEASATHQEIFHGALQGKDANNHAFGFFRTIKGLPQDSRAGDFLDLDKEGRPDIESRQRLERLQAEMHIRMVNNIHNYSANWTDLGPSTDHLEQLCSDVYDRLSDVIKEEVRQREIQDLVNQEVIAHSAFGRDRVRHFIGRENILAVIRKYLQTDNRYPLVLHSVSGMGKSALMAKAAQLNGPDVLVRFIGATPSSNDPRSLLSSLIHEIGRRNGLDLIPAADYASLVEEFGKQLSLATTQRPLILMIDALDQLCGEDPEWLLLWFPAQLPRNVKFIVTTESGNILSAIRARAPLARLVEVKTISSDEGDVLLKSWLGAAHRTLQPEQFREVLGKFNGCPRPLYLQLAFEEARRWRSYENVEDVVGPKGLGQNLSEILQEMFSRLSKRENHGSLLISRTVGALAASKDGLAEDELLDVLSDDPEIMSDYHHRFPHSPDVTRLPVIVWSRLRTDLEPYLSWRVISGSSILSLQRGQIDCLACDLYLSESDGKQTHKRLAGYFVTKADPQVDGTWMGDPRAMSQVPYHQFHAQLFPQLITTLTDDYFVRGLCTHFGQNTILDALELGLAVAREQHSLSYAAAVLTVWGYILNSERENLQTLIDSLLNSGHVRQAINMIVSMPPADASMRLLFIIHTVMDRGQHAVAEQLLPALLSVVNAIPDGTLKVRLSLVSRLTLAGQWAALRLLCHPKPQVMAVHIILFLAGTTGLDDKMAQELGVIIATIGDPYWRGICQLVLCCRVIRNGLSSMSMATLELQKTVKECLAMKDGIELSIIVARNYRWLCLGGFRPTDLADPGMADLELEDVSLQTYCTLPAPPSNGDSEACFDYIPERYERRQDDKGGKFIQVIRRVLGCLADCDIKWACEPDILYLVQDELNEAEADANNDYGYLLWQSIISATKNENVNSTGSRQIELRSLSGERRLEVILSLLRLGRTDGVISMVDVWSAYGLNSSEQTELFNTLRQLPNMPVSVQIVKTAVERIGNLSSTPSQNTLVAMAGCLLHHGLADLSVYWIDRLRSLVAPSMTINAYHKPHIQTHMSYLLLNLTLPRKPEDNSPESLKAAAEQQAVKLSKEHPRLAELLCREFGLRQIPLSHLADRILAFWAEYAAWGMSSDKSLQYFANILKLGIVNDDRERLRSWFFWLLVLGRSPDSAQIDVWRHGIAAAGTMRFRYELGLLQALDVYDSSDEKTAVFFALAKIADKRLNEVSPQMVANWGDAALRISNDTAEQATAMVFLAEACMRMGQKEAAETYLAIAYALDEDVLVWAHERIEVARLMSTGISDVVEVLRNWNSVSTFNEAWEGALTILRKAADQQRLLLLTEFLRRFPNGWEHLFEALCATVSDTHDAKTIAKVLFKYLCIIKNSHIEKGE